MEKLNIPHLTSKQFKNTVYEQIYFNGINA
jgi:hypothetical protein